MLTFGMSVASWAAIIKRSKVISAAEREADTFEDRFWSGMDLGALYQDVKKRKDDIYGIEEIFMLALLNLLVYVRPIRVHLICDGRHRASHARSCGS